MKQNVTLKHCNDPKDFIKQSSNIDHSYENIDGWNPNKKTQNIDSVEWYDC